MKFKSQQNLVLLSAENKYHIPDNIKQKKQGAE